MFFIISKYSSTYYIGFDIVPSIIDVWGYDRVLFIFFFCFKTCYSKTKQHKVIKFCKKVDIHNATRLHIFIIQLLI